MDTLIKTLVSLTLLVATASTAPEPGAPTISQRPAESTIAEPLVESVVEPVMTVVGASSAQLQAVDTALGLFAEAGLNLPSLEIEFSAETAPCKGHAGLFQPSDSGPSRVTICHRMSLFLLHELGHAWAHLNLTDEHRASYSDHWGLDNWNDHSQAWTKRGTEKAANTIAYTLNLSEPTDNPNIAALVCSYEFLTGQSLPKTGLVDC